MAHIDVLYFSDLSFSADFRLKNVKIFMQTTQIVQSMYFIWYLPLITGWY